MLVIYFMWRLYIWKCVFIFMEIKYLLSDFWRRRYLSNEDEDMNEDDMKILINEDMNRFKIANNECILIKYIS